MLRRIHGPDRGASFLEYAAVITLVAAIAITLPTAGLSQTVATAMSDSVSQILDADGAPPDALAGEDASSAPGTVQTAEGAEDAPVVQDAFHHAGASTPTIAAIGDQAASDDRDWFEQFGDTTVQLGEAAARSAAEEWNSFWGDPGGYLYDQAVEEWQSTEALVSDL